MELRKLKKEENIDLPFDQYSRQMQVLHLIDSLREKDQRFTILDIGGYKGATAYLHMLDKVTILDVFDVDEANYIKGDATNMSIENNKYDFVVSFDVFEHIPKTKRQNFVKEMSRVAKRGVIIAAPVKTRQAEQAEYLANNYYKKLHHTDHQWLYEHIKYGIPASREAIDVMEAESLGVILLPSNDINLWIQMQGAIFAASKHPSLHPDLKNLNRFYNKELGPFDGSRQAKQNYRQITAGFRNKRDLEIVEKKLAERYLDESKKIVIENEIASFYERAITAKSIEAEKLSKKAMGYEHACNELNKEIEKLREELRTITSSTIFKAMRTTAKIKHKVVRRKRS